MGVAGKASPWATNRCLIDARIPDPVTRMIVIAVWTATGDLAYLSVWSAAVSDSVPRIPSVQIARLHHPIDLEFLARTQRSDADVAVLSNTKNLSSS